MQVKLIAVAAAALLTANVAVVATRAMGPSEIAAAAYVPDSALGFVHVTVNPSLNQKRALAGLRTHLPDEARRELAEGLPGLMDTLLQSTDLDYERDIKPWLGDEVAAFVLAADGEPAVGVLLHTTDVEAARRAAQTVLRRDAGDARQRFRGGVRYTAATDAAFAVLDDFLVVGSPPAVTAAIDASTAGALADDAGFGGLIGTLNPDRIITYWVDVARLIDASEDLGGPTAENLELFSQAPLLSDGAETAGALFATPDSAVFESATAVADGEDPPRVAPENPQLMGGMPAAAWLAVAFPSADEAIRAGIGVTVAQAAAFSPRGEAKPGPDPTKEMARELKAQTGLDLEEDVFSWMGDGSLFVAGRELEGLYGAIIIESTDPAKTQHFVDTLIEVGEEQDAPVTPVTIGGLRGVTSADESSPIRGTLLGGDRLVLAVEGPKAEVGSAADGATGAAGMLADTTAFDAASRALGSGFAPVFYLDIDAVAEVVDSVFEQIEASSDGSIEVQGPQDPSPYIDPLAHLVVGTRVDGDHVLQRLVITAGD